MSKKRCDRLFGNSCFLESIAFALGRKLYFNRKCDFLGCYYPCLPSCRQHAYFISLWVLLNSHTSWIHWMFTGHRPRGVPAPRHPQPLLQCLEAWTVAGEARRIGFLVYFCVCVFNLLWLNLSGFNLLGSVFMLFLHTTGSKTVLKEESSWGENKGKNGKRAKGIDWLVMVGRPFSTECFSGGPGNP